MRSRLLKIFGFLAVLMIATSMLACGDNAHVHEYKKRIYDPTCVKEGYTEYKCECGINT